MTKNNHAEIIQEVFDYSDGMVKITRVNGSTMYEIEIGDSKSPDVFLSPVKALAVGISVFFTVAQELKWLLDKRSDEIEELRKQLKESQLENLKLQQDLDRLVKAVADALHRTA